MITNVGSAHRVGHQTTRLLRRVEHRARGVMASNILIGGEGERAKGVTCHPPFGQDARSRSGAAITIPYSLITASVATGTCFAVRIMSHVLSSEGCQPLRAGWQLYILLSECRTRRLNNMKRMHAGRETFEG